MLGSLTPALTDCTLQTSTPSSAETAQFTIDMTETEPLCTWTVLVNLTID